MAYSGGTGTELDPYQIATASDWTTLVGDTANFGAGKYFVVTANVDMGGATLDSVDGFSYYFYAQLDGRNHTLSNYVHTETNKVFVGLFGNLVAGGVIKNLKITGATLTGTTTSAGAASYCGILVGNVAVGGSIDNCHVTGTLDFTSNKAGVITNVAMLAGNCHGNIDNSTARGTIYIGGTAGTLFIAGGLAGAASGSATGTTLYHVNNCKSYTTITNNATGLAYQSYIGGIVGSVDMTNAPNLQNILSNSSYNGTINVTANDKITAGGITAVVTGLTYNCSATGSMTLVQTAAANGAPAFGGGVGVVGVTSSVNGIIRNCKSNMALRVSYTTANNAYYSGGFAGQNNGTITDCYCLGSMTDGTENSSALNLSFSGFVGYVTATSIITNSWTALSTYSKKGGSSATISGFWGFNAGGASFTGCFWNKTTSGITATNTGATGKITAELQLQSTFATYTFPTTWRIPTNSYPKLAWEFSSGVPAFDFEGWD